MISKRKQRFSLFKHRYLLAYFYASIAWLIAGTTFGILSILKVDYPAWHVLIYAIPVSSLVLLWFFFFWRQIKYIFLYFTLFQWSLALSITLLIGDIYNYWVYIIILPIYLFILFMLYVIYIRKR
ncbi:integral membrane protein [Acholeplasma laidlawii PG-8A]|uniref:Integral membrane protein n=1 Tax=Acholeplasma laidlawii (strain PG-8A) TaxID=441768 RepID=A9NG70_ACHLI|nr:integral membrane protein [Acholeplasma laidlawii PG-8A]